MEESTPSSESTGKPHRVSIIDNITSYLGEKNPFTHPVDAEDDLIWLFDNTAYQEGEQWRTDLVAAFFQKRTGRDFSGFVAEISEKVGFAKGDAQEERVKKRLIPLFNQVMPAHTAVVETKTNDADSQSHAEFTTKTVPSDRSGISTTTLHFPPGNYDIGEKAVTKATGPATSIPSLTTFAGPTGWSILSDIDDTIKVTLTDQQDGILRTTFLDDPQPIAGMPELYQQLMQKLQNPPIWYLSASPYNLYPFLRKFLQDAGYPSGSMYLRDASWMNVLGFLASYSRNTQQYKQDRMEQIYKNFSQRKFIVVGDSTQKDPESYGELYRRHPDWIKHIWIRKVHGVVGFTDLGDAEKQEDRNKPERFEKAFEGVPKDVWKTFDSPEELYPVLVDVQP